jgi:hypothetical protein
MPRQRDIKDTRELATETRECALEIRATEVADRERLLGEQQM